MRIKIGVIDSGIDKEHPRIKSCRIEGVTLKKDNNKIEILANEFADESGHGTAIAGIIHQQIPDIEIVAIKLSSYNQNITEDLLIAAIEWCISQEDIKILNISMGIASKTPYHKLHDICKTAFDKGIVICAAHQNMPGFDTYPASFPFVFGVTTGYIQNKGEYGYDEEGDVFIAKGTTQRLAWTNKGYRITSGTSFATAHFSALIAKRLLDMNNCNITNEQLYHFLKEDSNKEVTILQYAPTTERFYFHKKDTNIDDLGERLFTSKYRLDFAKNIALFPICEKEFSTILNFRSLCPYNISICYDYPRRFNFFNQSVSNEFLVKRNIEEEDFTKFDTLVVGYFLDQLFDANILFGYKLIESALKLNKNIITWDLNVYNYIKKQILKLKLNYTGTLYLPKATQKSFDEIMQFRHLPNVNVPVILVVGTSNKQGKITTQLRIMEIMSSDGYKLSHLSTEPQGILLGSEFVFPYGHKATVTVNEDLWGKYISTVMKGIERYNKPHIIVSGTQGKFLPRGYSFEEYTGEGLLSSLHYLVGILPDAIICAINPQDTVELINNMIQCIKIYSKAKILFFVMTPWERNYKTINKEKVVGEHKFLEENEMYERMKELQNTLGIPVINVMDRNNDKFILDVIENAFSK
jgi:uncharacterized NAD-dependent epimerase/dehydratase family protein